MDRARSITRSGWRGGSCLLLLLIPLLGAPSGAAQADDFDHDGVADEQDNCPRVANPGQQNSDGLPAGDACACGDVDQDGDVDLRDAVLVRRSLAGSATPAGYSAARCSVARPANRCDEADASALRGWLASAGSLSIACAASGLDVDPDANDDGVVNAYDGSIVGTCYGRNPAVDCACRRADTDQDGDIDGVDLAAVQSHFGQTGYPPGADDSDAPRIEVLAPPPGSLHRESPVTLRMLASQPLLELRVNGLPATPIPALPLHYEIAVALVEGANTLQITANGERCTQVARSFDLLLDSIAPTVVISVPADGAVVASATVAVSGTLDDPSAVLRVAGAVVPVAVGGTWQVAALPLAPGLNTISALATDPAGNVGQAQISVSREAALLGIKLSPAGTRLTALGAQQTYTVVGRYSDGSSADLTAASTGTAWAADNRFVASLSADGIATALANGTTQIRAENSGFAGTSRLDVEVGVSLDRIEVTPEDTLLREDGGTVALAASGHFGDGSLRDLTPASSGTLWSSSAPEIASVSADGLVTALAEGTVEIEARNAAQSDRARIRISISDGTGFVRGEVFDDALGLPLASAVATLQSDGSGPLAPARVVAADARGRFRLGGAEGDALVRVTRAGYTAVERQGTFPDGQAFRLIDARLTPLDPRETEIRSAVGGTLRNTSESLRVDFLPGSLAADAALRLTEVGPQGLVALLPPGWSPLVAAELSPPGVEIGVPALLVARNAARLPGGSDVVAVRYDALAHDWRIAGLAQVTADGREIAFALDGPGQIAFVVPDTGSASPPDPVSGALLGGASAAQLPTGATARSEVTPETAPASPTARARAALALDATAGTPSGVLLEGDVFETFQRVTGALVVPLPFTQDLIAFARPRVLADSELGAAFPITPSRAYTIHELAQGRVRVTLAAARARVAGVAAGPGGALIGEAGGEALLEIPPGALAVETVADVVSLALEQVEGLVPAGLALVAAAEVDLGLETLGAPALLSLARPAGLADDAQVVVAELFRDLDGVPQLRVVALAAIGAQRIGTQVGAGALTLPGVRREGVYLFLEPASPFGFVAGTAFTTSGALPQADVLVTAAGSVFADLTGVDGRFALAVPVGAGTLEARLQSTGDATSSAYEVPAPGAIASLDVALAVVGPVVLSVSPSAGRTGVALDAAVEVAFSEPIDPASVTPASFSLSGPAGVVVADLRVAPDGLSASLTPRAPLASFTSYAIALGSGIADRSGNPLAAFGPSGFRTLDTSFDRELTGAIEVSAPDARGMIVVRGGPGVAEPFGAIALINQSSGVILTRQAAADGSFTLEIAGSTADLLSLNVRTAGGSDTELLLGTFRNPDGSVTVGEIGGEVSFDSPDGPITLEIPPGSFSGPTTLRVTHVPEAEARAELAAVGLVPPDDPAAGPIYGGAIRIDAGGATSAQRIDVRMPLLQRVVDLAASAGRASAEIKGVLTRLESFENEAGETEWGMRELDSMRVIDGRLDTSTYPYDGIDFVFGGFYIAFPFPYFSLSVVNGRVLVKDPVPGDVAPTAERRICLDAGPNAVVRPALGAIVRVFGPLFSGTPFFHAVTDRSGHYSLGTTLVGGGSAAVTAQRVDTCGAGTSADVGAPFVPMADMTLLPRPPPPDTAPPRVQIIASTTTPTQGSPVTLTVIVSDNDNRAGRQAALESSVAINAIALPPGGNAPPQPVADPNDLRLKSVWVPLARGTYRIEATAYDSVPNTGRAEIAIEVGDIVIPPGENPEPGDANDRIPPFVLAVDPPEGAAGVAPETAIQIDFSEAVLSSATARGGDGRPLFIQLTGPNGPVGGEVTLSPDQTRVSLQPAGGLEPGEHYSLSVTSGITDLNGTPLDQDPNTANVQESFESEFDVLGDGTLAELTGNLRFNIKASRAAAVIGNTLFFTDGEAPAADPNYPGATRDGRVLVYDVANPAAPVKLTEILANGSPRAMAIAPRFTYRGLNGLPTFPPALGLDSETTPSEPGPMLFMLSFRRAGVDAGQGLDGTWLRMFDISDPNVPQPVGRNLRISDVSIGTEIEIAGGRAFIKLADSPNPGLAIVDLSLALTKATLLPIRGLRSTGGGVDTSVVNPIIDADGSGSQSFDFLGIDANGDGDYGDTGDALPDITNATDNVSGRIVTPGDTTDFKVSDDGRLVFIAEGHPRDWNQAGGEPGTCALVGTGRFYGVGATGPTGELIADASGGLVIADVDPLSPLPLIDGVSGPSDGLDDRIIARVNTPTNDTETASTRVHAAQQLSLRERVLTSVNSQDVVTDSVAVRDFAFVSNGFEGTVTALDVTNPACPIRVAVVKMPPIDGVPSQAVELARVGSSLYVDLAEAGTAVIDLDRILVIDRRSGSDVYPGLDPVANDANSDFVDDRISAVLEGVVGNGAFSATGHAYGGTHYQARIARVALPTLELVRFTGTEAELADFEPETPGNGDNRALLEKLAPVDLLKVGALHDPNAAGGAALGHRPDPEYVYFLRTTLPAASSATGVLDFTLQSLDSAGQVLRDGGFAFASASDGSSGCPDTSPPPQLYRQLDAAALAAGGRARTDPLGTLWLSKPFFLVREPLAQDDTDPDARPKLVWAGQSLRASLAAASGSPIATLYAPGVSDADTLKQILGRAAVTASTTIAADYVDSPEPEPALAPSTTTGQTATDVHLHSGEFTISATDLAIKGRALHYQFQRRYENQSLYNGPLGRGWDFVYNQRIRAVSDRAPLDYELRIVDRPGTDHDVVAKRGDLLLHDGLGRVDVFALEDTGHDPNDPDELLERLGLDDDTRVARFYKGPRGIFTKLLKLTDGTYIAIDPAGSQRRFGVRGELTSIADLNENRIDLLYDGKGRLRRIVDAMGRQIRFGWYKRRSDPTETDFDSDLDEDDAQCEHLGKIRRQVDFIDREIEYEYDANQSLVRVQLPEVNEGNGPSDVFAGAQRKKLEYRYGAGENASNPRFSFPLEAVIDPREAQGGGSARISNSFSADGKLESQFWGGRGGQSSSFSYSGPSTTVTDRRGFTTTATHNAVGEAEVVREQLASAPSGERVTRTTYNDDGLPLVVTLSEENEVAYAYDEGNPRRRSQANLLSVTRSAGPRGSGGSQASLPTTYADYDFVFNEARLAEDPGLLQTLYAYDANGNLLSTTRPENVFTEATYNDFGQVTSTTDGERNRTTYDYHSESLPDGLNPTSAPAGRTLAANEGGYLERTTLEPGSGQNTSFDGSPAPGTPNLAPLVTQYLYGMPASGRNSSLPKADIGYAGNVTSVVDPRGVQTDALINALNQTYQIVRASVSYNGAFPPLDFVESIFYDANNRVEARESQVAADGSTFRRVEYEYDALDHLLFERVETFGTPSQLLETEHQYDDNQNRILTILPRQNRILYEYDERNRLIAEIRGEGSVEVAETRYEYDGNDNRVAAIDGKGIATTTDYDGYDRPQFVTDRAGNTLEWSYDDNGLVRHETVRELGASQDLRRSHYFYDGVYRRIRAEDEILGDPALAGGADGTRTTRTFYDRNGRVVATQDDEGRETLHWYDGANRRIASRDALGNEIAITYDAGANPLRLEEHEVATGGGGPQTFVSSAQYDALGRMTLSVDPLGNTQTLSWDAQDNLVRREDPEANVVEHFFDLVNREERMVQHLGAGTSGASITTRREWNLNSSLAALVDDNGNRTSYAYDALDRPTVTTYPPGQGGGATQTVAVYDLNDNVDEFTDQNDNVVDNTWDANDRLEARSVARFSGAPSLGDLDARSESYEYDGLNRMLAAEDEDSRVELVYDSLDRVTRETIRWLGSPARDHTVTKVYDGVGTRRRLDYPSGLALHYGVDALDRIATIGRSAGASDVAAYDYVGPARPSARRMGNGVDLAIAYDGARRPLRLEHRKPVPAGTARDSAFDLRYAWTAAGQRVGEQRMHKGGYADLWSHDRVFRIDGVRDDSRLTPGALALDQRGQLVPSGVPAGEVVEPGYERAFSFDGAFNHLSGALVSSRAPNVPSFPESFGTQTGRNQHVALTEGGVQRNQTYDGNGNTLTMRLERRSASSSAPVFGEATLDYDYRNQPIRVRYASGDEALYRHDALGRRIEKEVTLGAATTRTRYVLDGARELEERDPDRSDATNTLRRFMFGGGIDELLAFDTSSGGPPYATRFLHESSIGSIVGLTDAAGVELEHYRYALNGAPVIESADYTPPALVEIRNLGAVLELDFSEPMHPDILSGSIIVASAPAAASLVVLPGAPASSFRTTYRVAASAPAFASISLAGVRDLSGNALLGPAVFPAPAPLGPPTPFPLVVTGPTPRGVSAEGNPFLFQGRRYDPETGLYYYRARYYSPTTGRFLQNDPKGYVDGPNLYAAFGANPGNSVDPMGTEDAPKTKPEEKKEGVLAWIGGLLRSKAEDAAKKEADKLKEKATEKATEVAETATGLAVGEMLETVGKAGKVIDKIGTVVELKGDIEACDGDPAICAAMASKYLERVGDATGLPGQLIVKPMAKLPNEAVEAGQKLKAMRAKQEREQRIWASPEGERPEEKPKPPPQPRMSDAERGPFYACEAKTLDATKCLHLLSPGDGK